jgi:hypothetical protein
VSGLQSCNIRKGRLDLGGDVLDILAFSRLSRGMSESQITVDMGTVRFQLWHNIKNCLPRRLRAV